MAIPTNLSALGNAAKILKSGFAGLDTESLDLAIKNLGAQFGNLSQQQILNIASTNDLTLSYFKSAVANSTMTDEQKKAIITAYEQTLATKAQDAANKEVAASTWSWKAAVTGLVSTMAAHPFMTSAIALSILIPLFLKLGNAAAEASKKANEFADKQREASKAASDEAQTLTELMAKYKKLKSQSSIDVDTRTEIQDVQQQITDLVGQQADGLDLVNGKLDEEYSKLKNISLETAKQSLDTNVAAYRAQKDAAEKATGTASFWGVNGYNYVGGRDDAAYELLKNVVDKSGNPLVRRGGVGNSKLFFMDAGTAQENIKAIESAIEVLKNTEDYNFSDSNLYSGLQLALDEYKKYADNLSETAKLIVNSAVLTEAAQKDESGATVDSIKSYQQYRQELIDAVSANKSLSAAMADGEITAESIASAVDNIMATNFPEWYEKVTQASTGANSGMDKTTVALENLGDSLSSIKTAEEAYNSVQSDIANKGKISLSTLSSLSGQYSDLNSVIADYISGKATESDVLSAITKKYYAAADAAGYDKKLTEDLAEATSKVSQTSTEAIDSLGESIGTLDSAASSLSSAFEEQSESGKLSVSTMLKIIDAGYAAALSYDSETGAVTLNKDAVTQLVSAKIAEQEVTARMINRDLVSQIDKERQYIDDLAASYAYLVGIGLESEGNYYNQKQIADGNADIEALEERTEATNKYIDSLKALRNSIPSILSGKYSSGKSSSKQEKTWAEKQKEIYEDYVNDIVHSVDLLEKQNDTEQKRIDLYKKLQDYVHSQADLYRSKGYDDNSEYVQDLQNLWWSYADSIKEIQDDLSERQKSAISDALDDAKAQMDFQIYISESMAKTYGEGTDAYKAEQDKQLQYYKRTQEAALAALDEYGKLGLAATDENVENTIKIWWDAQNNIVSIQKAIYETQEEAAKDVYDAQKEAFEKSRDALNDLIDLTEDLIKKEKEDQKQALEDQIEQYESIIDAKKESLKLTKDEYDYQKSVSEKTKSISDLQNRINELKLDDSREAQAERISLETELADQMSDLADTQHDKSIDLQEDALDSELDKFKETKQSEIDIIDSYLSQTGQLTQDAMDMIGSSGTELYQKLIDYNALYGDGIQQNVIDMWSRALDLMNEYGSVANSLSQEFPEYKSTVTPNYSDSIQPPIYSNENSVIAQMKANSAAWEKANSLEKIRLHQENIALASSLGLDYSKDYDSGTGKWYRNGVPLYHDGTPAAGQSPTLQQNELWAIIKNDEMILTERQQKALLGKIQASALGLKFATNVPQVLSSMQNINSAPITQEIDASITINGNADQSVVDQIKNESSKIVDNVIKQINKNFVKRGGRFNPQLNAI